MRFVGGDNDGRAAHLRWLTKFLEVVEVGGKQWKAVHENYAHLSYNYRLQSCTSALRINESEKRRQAEEEEEKVEEEEVEAG